MQVLLILTTALALVRLSASLGYRAGLVDQPDARKQHRGAVPHTGGIAVYFTVLLGVLALDIAPYTYAMLYIASAVFLVGLYDDFRQISASARLAIGFGSGVLLSTVGGIAIHNVGNLMALGNISLLLLTVPLTALAVAGLSNAYNMIDGIDGLAGCTLLLPLLVLYLLAVAAGSPMAGFLLLVLLPLLVFLCFNLGPDSVLVPRIFLGDAGSVTLGFLVTASLVYFSQGEHPLILPVTALWLVTVPLMDMLATMLRRLKNGRKLMTADRSHMHHTLMDMGLGPRQTLLLMVGYAGLCACAGLALEQIPEYLSLLCYFLLFCGHCLFAVKSDAIGRKIRALALSTTTR